MTRTQSRFRYWTFREWECCGLTWQLLMGKNWPDRWAWNPVCPKCGGTYGV